MGSVYEKFIKQMTSRLAKGDYMNAIIRDEVILREAEFQHALMEFAFQPTSDADVAAHCEAGRRALEGQIRSRFATWRSSQEGLEPMGEGVAKRRDDPAYRRRQWGTPNYI